MQLGYFDFVIWKKKKQNVTTLNDYYQNGLGVVAPKSPATMVKVSKKVEWKCDTELFCFSTISISIYLTRGDWGNCGAKGNNASL